MPQKSRMTALDVRAGVASLRPMIVGLRLANIYDINFSRRVYLLKFAKGDDKHHVLVESGIRFHPTIWSRDKNAIPSMFVMRLRKFLRTRRLEDFRQLGADRVIDFIFGIGDNATHLIVELYVSGNVILTDANYKILSILRPHSKMEEIGRLAVNEYYPITMAFDENQLSRVSTLLYMGSSLTQNQTVSCTTWEVAYINVEKCLKERLEQLKEKFQLKQYPCIKANGVTEELAEEQPKKGKKKKVSQIPVRAPVMTYHQAVSYLVPFAHSALISHSFLVYSETQECQNHLPNVKADKIEKTQINFADKNTEPMLQILIQACLQCIQTLISVSTPVDFLGPLTGEVALIEFLKATSINHLMQKQIKGYATIEEVVTLPANNSDKISEDITHGSELNHSVTTTPTTESIEMMQDFSPVQLKQYQLLESKSIKIFDDFLQCVDCFFSNLERLKQTKHEVQADGHHYSKAEKIKMDQTRRLAQLDTEQNISMRHANLIELNLDIVQQCITMLQAAIATGVSWVELWNHIKIERRNGHPLASIVHALHLEKNEAILLLNEESESNDDAFIASQPVAVPISLILTAYGNIEKLHGNRKQMQEKEKRTEAASKLALSHAETKAAKQLEKMSLVGIKGVPSGIVRIRKHFWFEKFNWFISSENYLVLAGRDATQNDMLYKRYFDKNDIYVHADAHGAPSCIIKNMSHTSIPPLTLLEAGRMSVCRSSAWAHKLVTGSWWVYPSQVSKTVPAGEYIVSGAFIVRGKKNMLPAWKLEMGLGILFHFGEDSLSSHAGERQRKIDLDDKFESATVQPQYKVLSDSEPQFPSEQQQHEVELALKQEEDEWKKVILDRQLKQLERKERIQQRIAVSQQPAGNTTVVDIAPTNLSFNEIQHTETSKTPCKKQKPDTLIRGKKDKLRRAKEKYKEQDLEDKKFRMALLGAKDMKDSSLPTIPTEHHRETQPKKVTDITSETLLQHNVGEKTPLSPHLDSENNAHMISEPIHNIKDTDKNNNIALLTNDLAHSEDAKRKNAESNNISEQIVEHLHQIQNGEFYEGHECDEEDKHAPSFFAPTNLSEIDFLTATPKKDDTLISAIPVCAPWTTLQSYKYKLKLLPGALKKGKAGQQCLKLLINQADTPIEKELIRLIDINDLNNAMLGSVALSMPGLHEIQKAEKAVKKQQKLRAVVN